jgi:hypothetical protein
MPLFNDKADLSTSAPVVVTGSVSIVGTSITNPLWITGSIGGSTTTSGSADVTVLNQVNVSVSSSLPVTVANFPVLQGISGSIVVTNWPSIVGVSGSVSSTPVGGTSVFTTGPQNVSGTVTSMIGNWPAFVGVSGSINVNNFPANQPTTITNWPATIGVSGTLSTASGGQNIYTSGAQFISGTVGISGSIIVTAPQSAPIWVTGSFATNVGVQQVTGSVQVTNFTSPRSTSHTTQNLTASLVSQVALASNANRFGVSVFNTFTSKGNAYISLGPIASTGSFIIQMLPGTYYSMDTLSTEEISYVFDAIPGNLMVTEQ